MRKGQEIPAGTRLTEPRRAGFVTDAKLDKVEALIAWGQEQGVSILDIAIGGLAAQPACSSVIAGATSPEQVKANAAAGEWEPTQDQLAAIDKIVPACRALSQSHNSEAVRDGAAASLSAPVSTGHLASCRPGSLAARRGWPWSSRCA